MVRRDHCRYCERKHYSDECPKYRTIEERKRRIRGSCFRCLRDNHKIEECKWNKTCVHCGEHNTHHRSLCPKKFLQRTTSENVSLSEEISEKIESNKLTEENVMVSSSEMVLMQTAMTEVKGSNKSKSQKVRVLMDCGSQRTYITQKLADRLGLKGVKQEEIKLVTFGSDVPTLIKTKSTTLSLKLNDGKFMSVTANIVPVICGNIQRRQIDVLSNEHLKHLFQSVDLADTIPTETECSNIEILIGNDYYLDIILSQKIEVQPGLYLRGSKLGWILAGRTGNLEGDGDSSSMLILTYGKDITESCTFQSIDKSLSTKPQLQDFWNVETIGITDNPFISDDETALEKFKDTLKFEEGRYQVTWPWKEDNPDLPVNKELAYGRLKSCVNKLRSKPDLMEKYDAVLKDQLNKGVIGKIEPSKLDGIQHYIPHHAVITPQKTTTKIRVVYDASAKTKPGYKSLNECLFRGPVMLHDVCGLLMRFRLHNVAIVADIEKAFLQIGLQPSQRDVTRFVWLKNIENLEFQNNVQEYRFCRVPFGVISSPFLLGATVETHLEKYNSDVALKLKNDIYVDNIITGTNSVSEAIQLYTDAKSMFKDASMNLREWLSNSDEVNGYIPIEDRTEKNVTCVLGHIWKQNTDTLAIRRPKDINECTILSKRTN